jgi:hypothetical protein
MDVVLHLLSTCIAVLREKPCINKVRLSLKENGSNFVIVLDYSYYTCLHTRVYVFREVVSFLVCLFTFLTLNICVCVCVLRVFVCVCVRDGN